MKPLILFIIFLTIPFAYAECSDSIPEEINQPLELCKNNYTINQITVNSDLDCGNSTLTCSDSLLHGILIEKQDSITVNNCIIKDCQNGIYSLNSNNITLTKNRLENNKIGIALESSSNLSVTNNILKSNQDSIVSLNSDVDEDMLKDDNDYDKNPRIIENQQQEPELIIEEEPEEVVEEPVSKPRISTEVFEIEEESAVDIMKTVLLQEHDSWSEKKAEKEARDIVEKYLDFSKENIKVKRTFEEYPDHTKIIVRVDPVISLEDVDIYEFLPKCLANNINEVKGNGFEVIEEDPLVVWHFDSLEKEEKLEYEVDKVLSEPCKELIKTLQLTTDTGTNWAMVITVSVILIIIGFVIVFFQNK